MKNSTKKLFYFTLLIGNSNKKWIFLTFFYMGIECVYSEEELKISIQLSLFLYKVLIEVLLLSHNAFICKYCYLYKYNEKMLCATTCFIFFYFSLLTNVTLTLSKIFIVIDLSQLTTSYRVFSTRIK
jgi:hypothetical protein